jgi:hypothetical protein
MAKAIVVVGVGPTNIQVLRDAASTEEDWQAFDRLTSRQGRKMAAAARREGEAWCVTVAAEHVTEEDLDADDAVRTYASTPSWQDVDLFRADGEVVPEGEDEERRKALTEFKAGGTMAGFFFVHPEQDGAEDAGPNKDEIDWDGFDDAAITVTATNCAKTLVEQGWDGSGTYDLGAFPGDAEALADAIGRKPEREVRLAFEAAVRAALLTIAQVEAKGAAGGVEDVDTVLREQGREVVIAAIAPGHLGWDDAAINAAAHRVDGVPDSLKDVYYRAYARAARERAVQIRDEVKRGEEISPLDVREAAGDDGAILVWASGEGDAKLCGWEFPGAPGVRAISTNGNTLWSEEHGDEFARWWDAQEIKREEAA